ncbi:large ribosomal subunit protein bL17m [Paroedura picta]|uniref:large ribosomal subunit protein bL17m n=1 Tax=Paroedura picta TaxID=143630 RepID=UPI001014EB10
MRLSAAVWISHGRVQRRLGCGPRSRLDLLRNLVTALVRHERLESTYARVDEMRFYAERLIDYGKRGDTDPEAMRMANFWLTEKDLIHKLFKVLAPRYQLYSRNYTRMLQIPNRDRIDRAKMAVIEYKGNHLPPLPLPHRDSEKTLVNQLLKGYRDDVLWTREVSLVDGHVGTAV